MAAECKKQVAKIQAINKATVHRICSGQVVLDLATAVKELIENSLDAGATSIEIRLKENGADLIEVADNGCGVSPENFQGLTLKYHTSKISEFNDLQTLSSFGFRGEALSSLCALADVSIVTRSQDENLGTRLVYDHSGLIVSQEKVARAVGTTVAAGRLFSTLPVRFKDFSRNIRREHARLLSVLQAYAVIAKGVRLSCSNQTGKNGRYSVMQTYGSSSLKENIGTVFGTKTAAGLMPLDVAVLDDACTVQGFVSKPGCSTGKTCQLFYVNGRPVDMPKFSKLLNELYKSFNSQKAPMAVLNFILPTTSYDVNVTPDKRKVFLHAETALLNALRQRLDAIYSADDHIYAVQNTADVKSAERVVGDDEGHRKRPASEASKFVEEDGVSDDDPDESKDEKRKDFLQQAESFSFKKAKPSLISKPHSMQASSHVTSTRAMEGSIHRCTETSASCVKVGGHVSQAPKVAQSSLLAFVSRCRRSDHDVPGRFSEMPILKQMHCAGRLKHDATSVGGVSDGDSTNDRQTLSLPAGLSLTDAEHETRDGGFCCNENSNIGPCTEDGPEGEEGEECGYSDQEKPDLCGASASVSAPDEDEVEFKACISKAVDEEPLTVEFSFKKFSMKSRLGLLQRSEVKGKHSKSMSFRAATLASNDELRDGVFKEHQLAAATKELERTFSKSDFKQMKVLGQFNRGFILAKLEDDIYIVDQHASDEKFNYERLLKSTVLNRQPLLRPLPVELSALEEVIIMTHLETFKQNGFDFTRNDDAPPGQRLHLSAIPFSKNVSFGVGDVQELVSLLADESAPASSSASGQCQQDTGPSPPRALRRCSTLGIRPSSVRTMLATRACRSSIMIGDALSKREMKRVLSHLSDLDSPWNCPHGRPTMRHLTYLPAVGRK